LIECEDAGISVVGVGLGLAPVHLSKLFPVSVYSPRSADFSTALSVALEISQFRTEYKIFPGLLIPQMEKSRIDNLFKSLTNPKAVINTKLGQEIRNKKMSMDMFEKFGDTSLLFMKQKLEKNSTKEPYNDNFFSGFRILIVCLYLGSPGTPDEKINPTVFDEGCGKSLKRKG
jgi:hypothetical protein